MEQEIQGGAATVPAEEKTKKKKLYKRWWFWLVVAILGVLLLSMLGGGSPSDLIDLPEEEYRLRCEEFSYDDIARYPDAHEKKLAKFTGKVVQVLRDGDDKLQLRVNVTAGKYNTYEDTVYVFYTVENGTNILEDDIITMYGELRGMIEYESVLGAKITIPRIYAKFIDVEK